MNFATDQILLSGSLLSVTGGNIYLQGILIGTGIFDGLGTAQSTGKILYPDITGASGARNTTILSTGSGAWNAANNNGLNLSGNLLSTGQNLYNDITGLSGLYLSSPSVYTTGVNNVSGNILSLSGQITSKPYIYYYNLNSALSSFSNQLDPNAQIFNLQFFDFSNYTGVKLVVNILSGIGGQMFLGYSNVFSTVGSTFSHLDTNKTFITVTTIQQIFSSGFFPIDPNARSGVYFSLISTGGSVSASSSIGFAYMALM
jgi:hypothetical protein